VYRQVHGTIVVYDVTNQTSFEKVVNHLNKVKEYCEGNIAQLIVGNKNDLKQVVDTEIAEKFSNDLGIPFFETSAKTGSNIQDVFDCMLGMISRDSKILFKNQNSKSGIKIKKENTETPKTGSTSGWWCTLG
jgi:GTPase SAR1 family protein